MNLGTLAESIEIMLKVREIRRLLQEANMHAYSAGSAMKMAEGMVTLQWPNFFEAEDGKIDPICTIYSYTLGPSRSHEFSTVDKALEAVTAWHQTEMSGGND